VDRLSLPILKPCPNLPLLQKKLLLTHISFSIAGGGVIELLVTDYWWCSRFHTFLLIPKEQLLILILYSRNNLYYYCCRCRCYYYCAGSWVRFLADPLIFVLVREPPQAVPVQWPGNAFGLQKGVWQALLSLSSHVSGHEFKNGF